MSRHLDIALTGLAPAIWGSTYIVTTELLPPDFPFTVSFLRALPAGILLLLLVRKLPKGRDWLRVFVLGGLNFSLFWGLLFVAAYRLPGGVAATVGAIQPLIVIFFARAMLGVRIRPMSIIAAVIGIGGVAMLILTPAATLDPVGVLAGLGGAISMAAGTVLSRKWRGNASLLTFTAWQLSAGGLLLLPVALVLEPSLPMLSAGNWAGFIYLAMVGAALTYLIWFRGVARLEPGAVAAFGFLSPTVAVILGWLILGQGLSTLQCLAVAIVLGSVWLSQFAAKSPVGATKLA